MSVETTDVKHASLRNSAERPPSRYPIALTETALASGQFAHDFAGVDGPEGQRRDARDFSIAVSRRENVGQNRKMLKKRPNSGSHAHQSAGFRQNEYHDWGVFDVEHRCIVLLRSFG